MTRCGVVDFGSNTVSYLVADLDGVGSTPREIERDSRYVRLSQGLSKPGLLHPEARRRALDWSEEVARRLREHGVQRTRAVATEVLRRAHDAEDFAAELRQRTGLSLQIVDGAEEAGLAYAGVRWGWPEGPLAVLDIGGGSSELALGDAHDVQAPGWSHSLPVGAVNLSERAGEDMDALSALVDEVWPRDLPTPAARQLVVLGGTARNLAAFDLGLADDPALPVQGHRLSFQQVQELGQRMRALTPAQRVEAGIPSGRADVSVAGLAILQQVMRRLGLEVAVGTVYTLRHGLVSSLRSPDGAPPA